MMQTDVKGKTCPSGVTPTTVYLGRTRFKGLFYSNDSATNNIIVLDGTTELFRYLIIGGSSGSILLPGEGVLCLTSLIVSQSNDCNAVAYYG